MTRFDRTSRTTRPVLRGALTALVTPFTEDGALDERAAFAHLRRRDRVEVLLGRPAFVLAGIDGLVPCGTTGESPTLTTEERERVIAITIETVAERPSRGRVAIVAGTGTNDTRSTIAATRRAAQLGADAALVVAPYYNRPDGRMLEAHYRAVADEGDLPVVVYNVPSRTGTNVPADVFLRLAEHPRIVAVKEASGNMEQIATICRDRPRDVAVLAGDDAWTLPMLALGGDGVISVVSNEIPGEMVALCAAARAGDWETARRIHARWLPLFSGNFRGGPNPVPVKAALAAMGILRSDAVRQPLLPLADADRTILHTLLRETGLVEGGGRFTGTGPGETVEVADVIAAGAVGAAEICPRVGPNAVGLRCCRPRRPPMSTRSSPSSTPGVVARRGPTPTRRVAGASMPRSRPRSSPRSQTAGLERGISTAPSGSATASACRPRTSSRGPKPTPPSLPGDRGASCPAERPSEPARTSARGS